MKLILLILALILIVNACSKESALLDPRTQLIGSYYSIRSGNHLGVGAGAGTGLYTTYPDSAVVFDVFLSGTQDLQLKDSTTLSLDSMRTDYYRYHQKEMTAAPFETTSKTWTLEFFPLLDSVSLHYEFAYDDWSYNSQENIYFKGKK